jgi:hypothetical protein
MWSTVGELNVGPPPPGVTEMDMPLIAALDLPIDRAGTYTMAIAVDDQAVVQVPLHVRSGVATMRPTGLVS